MQECTWTWVLRLLVGQPAESVRVCVCARVQVALLAVYAASLYEYD